MTITPIHVLPPEIMTRIFQLVLDTQPCYFADQAQDSLKGSPILYPEILSHICSRWRHIAINSRVLWSHVDLVPFNTRSSLPSSRFIARAAAFAARSGHSPLHVHVAGRTTSNDSDSLDIDTDLNEFCISIAPRMKSLDLSTYHSFRILHLFVLQSCLTNCVPGSLHELVVTSNTGILSSTYGGDIETGDPFIDIDQQHNTECLLAVRDLRLTGIYFPWAHPVYHGLVELHLMPQNEYLGPSLDIPQAQFMGILNGSPKLRILYFGLNLTELIPHNNAHTHTKLDDLEVLNVRLMNCDNYEALFRFLSPGSKSLQISLTFQPGRLPSVLFSDEFESFFARSNITQLYIECNGSLQLPQMFRSLHMPGLRVLILADCNLGTAPHPRDGEPRPSSNAGGRNSLSVYPRGLNWMLYISYTAQLAWKGSGRWLRFFQSGR